MTMTPLRSMPVLLVLLACALLAGCARKKPVLVMPQEPPPAAAPTPAPTPAPEARQEPAQPEPSPTPAPGEAQSTTPGTANSTKAKPHPTPKKSPQQVARNGSKTVVKNEDVPAPVPPPLSPEAQSQKAATEQLLQSTESAIKGLTRQLSKEEQAILAQITDFIKQSHGALDVRDFVRARNLAQKAHLLSDELVKQK
jgi:outer membrane biosynthesis protein TonB